MSQGLDGGLSGGDDAESGCFSFSLPPRARPSACFWLPVSPPGLCPPLTSFYFSSLDYPSSSLVLPKSLPPQPTKVLNSNPHSTADSTTSTSKPCVHLLPFEATLLCSIHVLIHHLKRTIHIHLCHHIPLYSCVTITFITQLYGNSFLKIPGDPLSVTFLMIYHFASCSIPLDAVVFVFCSKLFFFEFGDASLFWSSYSAHSLRRRSPSFLPHLSYLAHDPYSACAVSWHLAASSTICLLMDDTQVSPELPMGLYTDTWPQARGNVAFGEPGLGTVSPGGLRQIVRYGN